MLHAISALACPYIFEDSPSCLNFGDPPGPIPALIAY